MNFFIKAALAIACFFLGHIAPVTPWSTPKNGFRCDRCKKFIEDT